MVDQEERWDVIIVGAGSSGCTLAGRLSEDPSLRVLLVEAGPWDNSPFIRLPKGLTKLRADPERVYYYAAERGNNEVKAQPETMVRGRGLGGSSTLNGMVYHRGQPQDYDDWEALGLSGWGWKDVLPCFLAIEDNPLPPTEWRGPGGPVPLRVASKLSPIADAIIDAADDLGLPRKEEPNLPEQIGMSPVAENINRRSQRVTAAHAFLPPQVRNRPNLRIMVNTRVDRLVLENRQVTGIDCMQDGKSFRIHANKYVVVSVGAMETPRLLQVSGIGPAEHLKGIGVDPVLDLPGVGQNYLDHFIFGSSWRLHRHADSQNREYSGWRLVRNMARYFLMSSGPMSTAVPHLSGFAQVVPDSPKRADCELLWMPHNLAIGKNLADISFDSEPGCTMTGFPLRGTSQGTVMAASSDPAARPVVTPNYLATNYDRAVMVGLVRLCKDIMTNPRLGPFVAAPLGGVGELESDEEIVNYAMEVGSSAQHGCGTCKMGPDHDRMAVLDEKLSVRGIGGLKVADCSIMPAQVSANTNGPAMMIGWRASEIVRDALS